MEKKVQQLLNLSEMSHQTLLMMENSVPAGQWRLGLCRHKWTRSHHYWASISPSYGAQSHFKDAIPGWDEEKWCRCTGKTGQLLTPGCWHVCVIGSPSCPSGFWVLLSSQPCGTMNVKNSNSLGYLSQIQPPFFNSVEGSRFCYSLKYRPKKRM